MYMGESMDAMPTPIPATKRAAIKISLLGEKAIAREDKANKAADNISPGLRPYLSDILPAMRQPKMAPNAYAVEARIQREDLP